MNPKRALFASLIILILVAGGAVFYLSDSNESGLVPVRIGYQALASSWAFYVANERLPGREKSFFEEEGLQIEAIRFDSSNMGAEALLRGDIATNSATTMTVLFNIEENAPGTLKCYGFQMHTPEQFLESVIVRKDSGIDSYEALKGKTIGVFPGSLSQSLTKTLLDEYIDADTEAKIVQLSPPIQLQAITSGQVDALISYEPTTTLALEKGVADLLESSPWAKHLFSPFPVATYCITNKYIATDPDVAARIARAMHRAIDYLGSHRESAAGTIPKYTGIDLDIAVKLNQPEQKSATDVDQQAIQRLAELYQELGLTSKLLDTTDLYYVPD